MLLVVDYQGAITAKAAIGWVLGWCPFGLQPDRAADAAAHARGVIEAHAAPLGAVQNASSCSPFHSLGTPFLYLDASTVWRPQRLMEGFMRENPPN